jgi:hypothetical protein
MNKTELVFDENSEQGRALERGITIHLNCKPTAPKTDADLAAIEKELAAKPFKSCLTPQDAGFSDSDVQRLEALGANFLNVSVETHTVRSELFPNERGTSISRFVPCFVLKSSDGFGMLYFVMEQGRLIEKRSLDLPQKVYKCDLSKTTDEKLLRWLWLRKIERLLAPVAKLCAKIVAAINKLKK